MLPIGQALWLKELETYITFPPLQDPASYNLEQVMQQVREHEDDQSRGRIMPKASRAPSNGRPLYIRLLSGRDFLTALRKIPLACAPARTRHWELPMPSKFATRQMAFAKTCVITVLMTAAIRPSQSNTGAPEAPWSTAKRLSPSYISRSAVPASLPSIRILHEPTTPQSVGFDLGRRTLRDDLPA